MASSTLSTSTRIADVFAAAHRDRRTAFMPFVTVGDPDAQTTVSAIQRLAAAGVDLIEVGFPYSDPIADGPVIQASYTRALQKGLTVQQIFDAVRTLDANSTPPLVAMVSYAIVLRRGVEQFVRDAAEAGFSGFIIPDLPASEAQDVFRIVRAANRDLIQLIAPTTARERVREILSACSGFVYCLAVAGVTGEREQIADSLVEQLRWLRTETKLPLAAGFGIGRPEHVATLRSLVDGVIVGSAIVRRLEQAGDNPKAALNDMAEFATSMLTACRS
jgi:tryptophan synthase alpha chain